MLSVFDVDLFEKTKKIIESCNTTTQVMIARKYLFLTRNIYETLGYKKTYIELDNLWWKKRESFY